jgi:hypothetical protein
LFNVDVDVGLWFAFATSINESACVLPKVFMVEGNAALTLKNINEVVRPN